MYAKRDVYLYKRTKQITKHLQTIGMSRIWLRYVPSYMFICMYAKRDGYFYRASLVHGILRAHEPRNGFDVDIYICICVYI